MLCSSAFRNEGSDPATFYGLLADDTVSDVANYSQLSGCTVLDVGGASGYVADAFRGSGASAVTAEYDTSQMTEHGRRLVDGIIADGCALPIATGAVDVGYSSNVLEHVVSYEQMLSEMVRVVSPGGVIYITFTNWLSPWGGHETSPWHYLGGEWAARRYRAPDGVTCQEPIRCESLQVERGRRHRLVRGLLRRSTCWTRSPAITRAGPSGS